MHRFIAIAVVALSAVAFAQDKKAEAKPDPKAAAKPEAPPPPPPEVKKTTDAFVGSWATEATMEMGGKTEKVSKLKMDCQKIALGGGAYCSMAAKSSMGPMEQSCMAAYDPEGKAMHFMCVTSMGEVHDHKCNWTDDKTLTCEPYKGTMGGKPMTEDVTFSWTDAKTMSSTSVTTMGDGTKMTFVATGKRK
jgi:hypothetical protein